MGLAVRQPNAFHASVVISDEPNEPFGFAQIPLDGISADSYDFTNGVLQLFSANHAVDTLRLNDQSSDSIEVQSYQSPSPSVVIGFFPGVPDPGTGGVLPSHT